MNNVSSTDGITGTALAREHQIDTIVVDFNMPDLNGNQVTQMLLMKEHPTLPVETDWTKMVELVQKEAQIHKRRLELSKDHNGTQEEREAVVNALNGLRVLRMDASAWRERQSLK